jgi:hypothetical protein
MSNGPLPTLYDSGIPACAIDLAQPIVDRWYHDCPQPLRDRLHLYHASVLVICTHSWQLKATGAQRKRARRICQRYGRVHAAYHAARDLGAHDMLHSSALTVM